VEHRRMLDDADGRPTELFVVDAVGAFDRR
jgi:hypothetical protein